MFGKPRRTTIDSLDHIIAERKRAGSLGITNQFITTANFPETGIRGELIEVSSKDLHLQAQFSTEQVLRALDAQGYRPATMYELASYECNSGNTLVVALGSVWRNFNYDYVGYLSRISSHNLCICDMDSDWDSIYRFLAVRK